MRTMKAITGSYVVDSQGLVHLYKGSACLGEISPGHASREIMRVVLVEVEDLVESLHVDCCSRFFGLNRWRADRITEVGKAK